jgi:MFS superfamily sulfate permease-like transporter
MWHGVFLLVCVALIPVLLHKIPLAALAAMLIYTGYRLAHPSEFAHAWHIGPEQMAVFAATIVGVLATDLLIGIFIGIGVELFVHLINGVPLTSLLKPSLEISEQGDNTSVIALSKGATFTNWIPLRRAIENAGLAQKRNLVVDLSNTKLVDHSTMNKLSDMQRDFKREGLTLEVIGLDDHKQFSKHAQAARKRVVVKS